jgi:magnesium-transporting ATPase (P-type)
LLLRTVLVSLAIGLCAFGCFERALAEGCSTAQARTIAVNAIVVAEVGYLFACRSLRLPIWRIQWFGNPYVWIGAVLMLLTQIGFTYLPVMNRLLHTEAIPLQWWLVLSVIGLAVFLAAEAKKIWVAARKAETQRFANSQ